MDKIRKAGRWRFPYSAGRARPPTSRGEYYFSLGWIRYYRYRTIERVCEAAQPPRLDYTAASVVRSEGGRENSGERL